MLINDLEAAISAVCPIVSLSIGDTADRTTWKVVYAASATAAQQRAAENVIATFVPLDTSEATAAEKISAGLAIVSTSAAGLNGTYAVDERSQQKMQGVATYILANNRFPARQTVFPWPDIAGTPHGFPSIAVFMTFVTAVADYVAAVELASGQANPTWPADMVTIP